jgi:hypothetical protein
MKDIIVKVTNFVNENTILLIGICAFLILVLIVYLIDNSIKTKKMQKALTEIDAVEDKVIESTPEVNNNESVSTPEETKFDSISLVEEEPKEPEVKFEEPEIEVSTTIEEEIETPVVEQKEEPKFTNKKSLSEILSKKNESININDIDKSLEETTDFNNTF